MDGAGTRIAAAARSGAAFAAEGWRDAWAPLLLVAAGQATAFVSGHVDIGNVLAGRLQLGGWIVSGLALLPALGALYRSAVGGRALKDIGPGGLQVDEVERRLVGVGLLLAVASGLALAMLLIAGAAAWYPLRNMGVIRVPVIGPFGLWFLAASPVLAVVGWFLLLGLSRIALLFPAAAAETRLDMGRTLRGSRRWNGSLAASTLLFDIVPVVALVAVTQLLGWLERGQAGGLAGAIWPTPDAVAAGVVLSTLWAFVLLPAGVGARTSFYARVLAQARAAERRLAVAVARDDVRLASGAEPDRASEAAVAAEAPGADSAIDPETEAPPAVAASTESEDAEASELGAAGSDETAAPREASALIVLATPGSDGAASIPEPSAQPSDAQVRPAARWTPPVPSVRGAALAQAVTTPMLLAHANDRDLPPPWWMPPEHPEGPSVA